MGDKHAYLIIAHGQFPLLALLIQALDHERHDIYLHIDAKVKEFDWEGFRALPKKSRLFFVPRRNVGWGDFNMIRTELELLRQASKEGYAYYHLLSGADLPLKNPEECLAFFDENAGKEWVHFAASPEQGGMDVSGRVKYYHLWQNRVGRKKRGWGKRLANLFLRLQKALGVNRLRGKDLVLRWGANWFSISHELAQYVLSKEREIASLCRMSACADEVFLQTLVWNSPFRERLYFPNESGDYRGCMRLVDWERGDPWVFVSEDYDFLRPSDFLFARKFDWEKDAAICLRLVEENRSVAPFVWKK